MKALKLKAGDFFHVEVIKSEIDDEVELEIKDGPMKGENIFLDLISNPGLEEDEYEYEKEEETELD